MLPDQLLFSTHSNLNEQILIWKKVTRTPPPMYYVIPREAYMEGLHRPTCRQQLAFSEIDGFSYAGTPGTCIKDSENMQGLEITRLFGDKSIQYICLSVPSSISLCLSYTWELYQGQWKHAGTGIHKALWGMLHQSSILVSLCLCPFFSGASNGLFLS